VGRARRAVSDTSVYQDAELLGVRDHVGLNQQLPLVTLYVAVTFAVGLMDFEAFRTAADPDRVITLVEAKTAASHQRAVEEIGIATETNEVISCRSRRVLQNRIASEEVVVKCHSNSAGVED